mgnify:CR=1 FL=1
MNNYTTGPGPLDGSKKFREQQLELNIQLFIKILGEWIFHLISVSLVFFNLCIASILSAYPLYVTAFYPIMVIRYLDCIKYQNWHFDVFIFYLGGFIRNYLQFCWSGSSNYLSRFFAKTEGFRCCCWKE